MSPRTSDFRGSYLPYNRPAQKHFSCSKKKKKTGYYDKCYILQVPRNRSGRVLGDVSKLELTSARRSHTSPHIWPEEKAHTSKLVTIDPLARVRPRRGRAAQHASQRTSLILPLHPLLLLGR